MKVSEIKLYASDIKLDPIHIMRVFHCLFSLIVSQRGILLLRGSCFVDVGVVSILGLAYILALESRMKQS